MRRRATRWVALALAVPVMTAGPASAFVPEKTPRRAAEAISREAAGRRAASGGTTGIIVMRGGRVVFGMNPDQAMVPASLIKLATTTAALLELGPTFRFRTTVRAVRSGSVATTLALVGGGDPTLSTEVYRRRRFLPRRTDRIKRPAFSTPSPTVDQLAARVRAAGIRRVAGDLIADDSIFDAARTQPGWLASYTEFEPDIGYISGLTVNEGRADFEGEVIVDSPTIAAGRALRDALLRRGIRVDGSIRRGRAPANASVVAHVDSPPLSEIVDFTNRYSINLDAEFMLKRMGGGTTAGGIAKVRDHLAALGVPLEGFTMTDGSGLSVLSRMTPRALATLLEVIRTRKGRAFDVLRASVPVAGEPGTLQSRMEAPPTGHNLRGKTGQIRNVRTMAGWVTASDGIPVVYVVMYNGVRSPFALTGPLNLFGLALALLPRA